MKIDLLSLVNFAMKFLQKFLSAAVYFEIFGIRN